MRLNHENLARYDLLFTCNRNFCKEFSGNIVVDLINEKCTILMSEITLFEILAKGAKYVASSLLRAKRVIKGIRSLLYDDRVHKIPIHDTYVLLTALELRKLLSDFIDCIILSAAINYADILLTEDEDIHRLLGNEKFLEIVQEINLEFKVMRYSELEKILSE